MTDMVTGSVIADRPSVLIISHDQVSRLDRRIEGMTGVFREHGWNVSWVLTGLEQKEGALDDGLTFRATPRPRLDAVLDSYWDSCFPQRAGQQPSPEGLSLANRLALERTRQGSEWYPLPYTASLSRAAWDQNADLVIGCDLVALPAAHDAARWLGVPLWYDSHEFYTGQIQLSARMHATLVHHERRCILDCDRVITVSDGIAELLRMQYDLPRLPDVLFNAPSFSRDDMNPSFDLRRYLGLPSDARLLIYHGGLVRDYRNLEGMICGFAATARPGWHLILLGDGDHSHFSAMATDAKSTLTGGSVIVHRSIPQNQLPSWLVQVDACVIPYDGYDDNHRYCWPNKFSDCIELDVPVIANEGLVCVNAALTEFGIGMVGAMDTVLNSADTFSRATDWCNRMTARHLAPGFMAARQRFGRQEQERKLKQWIADLEQTLPSRTMPRLPHS